MISGQKTDKLLITDIYLCAKFSIDRVLKSLICLEIYSKKQLFILLEK